MVDMSRELQEYAENMKKLGYPPILGDAGDMALYFAKMDDAADRLNWAYIRKAHKMELEIHGRQKLHGLPITFFAPSEWTPKQAFFQPALFKATHKPKPALAVCVPFMGMHVFEKLLKANAKSPYMTATAWRQVKGKETVVFKVMLKNAEFASRDSIGGWFGAYVWYLIAGDELSVLVEPVQGSL